MAEEVEGPFNSLLKHFENDIYVPNHTDSEVIFRYVANIFQRTHQRRAASRYLQGQTRKITKEILCDPFAVRQLAAAYSFVLQRSISLEDVVRGMKPLIDRHSVHDQNDFFLSNLARHENGLLAMLRGKPYCRLIAPLGTKFILSDTVITTRVPVAGDFSIGEGFNKANVQVLLPVSPRMCIQIGVDTDLRVLQSHEVHVINRDSTRLMDRWLFSNSNQPEIQQAIDDYGATVKYSVNAFVTPQLTKQRMMELLFTDILHPEDPEWLDKVARARKYADLKDRALRS